MMRPAARDRQFAPGSRLPELRRPVRGPALPRGIWYSCRRPQEPKSQASGQEAT